MKSSVTAMVCLLFAAVVGTTLFLERTPSSFNSVPAPAGETPQASKWQLLEKGAKLQSFEILPRQKESIKLSLDGAQWNITQPVQYPADPMIAGGLAKALLFSKKRRVIQSEQTVILSGAKDDEDFGLANADFKISIQLEGDSKPRILCFGGNAPVDGSLYARWEGENEYFLLDPQLKAAFEKSLYFLREKRVFRKNFKDLTSIFIRSPQGDYEWSVQDKNWFWMEPILILGEKVEAGAAKDVLTGFRELMIKEFLDKDKGAPPSQEISDAGVFIRLQFGPDSQTLWLGDEAPGKDGFFARVGEEPVTVVIAQAKLKEIFEMIEREADDVFI